MCLGFEWRLEGDRVPVSVDVRSRHFLIPFLMPFTSIDFFIAQKTVQNLYLVLYKHTFNTPSDEI